MESIEAVRGRNGSVWLRSNVRRNGKAIEERRVMQLHRQGLEYWQIAERRGLTEERVSSIVASYRRRTRRSKAGAK